MPTVNAAVSPVAPISPQTGNAGVTATAEGQAATAFATLLQEQMADPGAAAANEAALPDATAPLFPAQLSQLFGTNELAEWIAANLAQGSGSGAKAKRNDDEQAPAAPAPALGSLLVPAAVLADRASNSATLATKTASDAASTIGARSEVLSSDGQGEAKAATDAPRPAGFATLVDRLANGANGNLPTTVPMTTSPAIVAATADTIAIAARSDTKSPTGAESLPSPNRDPNITAAAATTTALPQPVPSANETAATLRVATPVGTAGWDTEVGNRIAWMASHQQGRADLVLTPPQLGRIEISLSVNGDQANAFFVSANPAVRETLEGALPRLREILADAGITLGQAQVGSESPGQSANRHENSDNSRRGPNAVFIGDPAATRAVASSVTPWSTAGRGMVDTFA